MSASDRLERLSPQLGDSDFRHLSDPELSRLSDDGLLQCMRAARAAGKPGEVKRGLKELVVRHTEDVRRRVRMKIPPADVDDVTQTALISAITSAFAGSSTGEFQSWLNTIVARRIADFHRDREGDPAFTALVEQHEGDGEFWGEQPQSLESDARETDLRLTIARTIEEFNEVHQVVIVLYCYLRRQAADAADEVNGRFAGTLDQPMTENNVQAIGSRFRKRLRDRLVEDDISA
jgi:RNA polymerase sigma factor (sigma-70 family)